MAFDELNSFQKISIIKEILKLMSFFFLIIHTLSYHTLHKLLDQ